jgi:hypothetical protein
MPSSLGMDCSPSPKPTPRRANPDEETTDRRAVCGKTACTVRREGRFLPYPYWERFAIRSGANLGCCR